MTLIAPKAALLASINAVFGAASTRPVSPQAGHILLRPESGKLALHANNFEYQMSVETGIDCGIAPVSVDARKFRDIVSSAPDGDIRIAVEDARAIVRFGRSRFALATLPGESFPLQERSTSAPFAMDASDLLAAIDAVAYAQAVKDVRYYLNGVYFELLNGELSIVATDGHRLAVATAGAPDRPDFSAIVPRDFVAQMQRVLGEGGQVSLAVSPGRLDLSTGNRHLSTKLIDGRYPDWRQVVPDGGAAVHADRADLASAVERALLATNDKNKTLAITFAPGALRIQAQGTESEADEQLDAECTADVTIGLDGSYVLDSLRACDSERVTLAITDAARPVRVDNLSGIGVIMPVRL